MVTKKKTQEAHVSERTMSSDPKSRTSGVSKKKHIAIKRKKVSKRLGPSKRKTNKEEELSSKSKRKRKEKEKKVVPRETRNVVLGT